MIDSQRKPDYLRLFIKKKYDYPLIKKRDKKKFKSNEISITLYKKIDFKDTFPENIQS